MGVPQLYDVSGIYTSIKARKMKKLTAALVLFLMPLVIAQEAEIDLNHFGYGKTPQEAKFTIHCTGEAPASNITLYVDGQKYKTINAYLTPTKGIEASITLEPGHHLIEARSLEGAYDSVEIEVSSGTGGEYIPPKQPEDLSFARTNTFKALIVVLALILVVVVWLLTRKQALDLS
ncbi:MAG: hypothetical protein COS07_00075 [Candidatus Aenigmarchaeota archaeon CG01_land_8_20_14_3_00_37_9]|nr:MAG: hypothetical protein COS07_00075 [Candidatus Aenigmarchaeota archaeon CG01_land_8_20_14_3_00_37_9]